MGDARELAPAIPDESVDLIFTDPEYDKIDDYRWLAETAARILKLSKSVLAFCAHAREIQAGQAMLGFGDLVPGPILQHYYSSKVGRLFSHSVQCNVAPCLWFSKGIPSNEWMAIQQADYLTGSPRGHKWGKNFLMIQYRIMRLTNYNDVVVDFFAGGGTVPAVCKMLGRQYLAFEIDPETAEKARERVRMTQPPLFTLQPQQMEFTVQG